MRAGSFTMRDHDQVLTSGRTRVMDEATASVTAALLGLAGFEVLAAAEAGGEVEVLVETATGPVGCPRCGAIATAKDRRPVWVRDLPVGGRPVVICWVKRIWCCRQERCPARTWTEEHEAIAPRAGLTERARAWAFDQVGRCDAAVSDVAAELAVAWHTVMTQVRHRGTAIVDDPARLAGVSALGVDETAFLRATGTHPTAFATGITDLTPGRPARLLDVVEGRSGTVLGAGSPAATSSGAHRSPRPHSTRSAATPPPCAHSYPARSGYSTRSTSPAWPSGPWTTSLAACSRKPPATAAAPATRCTGCCQRKAKTDPGCGK
jgi:Helix-turn-helix domain of transposase family ISL3